MDDNQQQDTGVSTADSVDQQMTDDAEWGAAFEKNYGPDFNKSKKDEGDDAGKGDDDSAGQGTDDASKSGGEEDEAKKSDDTAKNDDDSQDQDVTAPYRDARQVQRELEADTKAMRDDIRKELFADLQTELTDADGDPIRTPQDVMKLLNPNTKKPFTEEEAVQYLFAAQRNLEKEISQAEAQVAEVAEVNIMIRDETDNIRAKFGDLLTKMPDLRKEIWADYKATLVLDPKTNLIVKAPVSLEKFFTRALQPYAEYAEQLKAQNATQTKTAETKQHRQNQADRTDVISGGKGDVTDPEDDEWNNAFKKQYGNK